MFNFYCVVSSRNIWGIFYDHAHEETRASLFLSNSYNHEGISIFKYCDTCYGSVLIHIAFLFTAPLETLCL